MFSFHKPRVYRSAEGCCICRAKSSSSRFTDSRKYEEDSMKCFDLKYPRYGEICNACVLLVKRFKRLPAGSQRHWGHVVDARAGPGTKTLTKIKRTKDESSRENIPTRSSQVQGAKSAISEKFSKIFKKSKNKKLKFNSRDDRHSVKILNKSPNKLHAKMTLLKRPNSIESDNEHSHESSPGPISPQNGVEFQTQTRSSLHRTKTNVKSTLQNYVDSNKSCIKTKSLPKTSGSKRRKKLSPQKNRVSNDTNVKFFDEVEWIKRTTCCGTVYECTKMPGATIIELDEFRICEEHRNLEKSNEAKNVEEKQSTEIAQNSIKTTLPAIVKLSLPLEGSSAKSIPTPVLKKHHLFYKRQSESFPHGDIVPMTETTTQLKTESQEINASINNNSLNNEKSLCESVNKTQVQVTVCDSHLVNLQRYTNAKVSTVLDKPIVFSDASKSADMKPSSFLHKMKSDAGKIVKHSIEKINSTVRIKAQDLSEIKNIAKTVDKNCILSKTHAPNIPTAATTLAVPELSPTSSTSTKFSDNSSDSGFDENVQDRKSVSPLQQENDSKLITRPPPHVQTLILASGVRVHGQQQNLVYAGNEAAAKILQNRIQQQNIAAASGSNNAVLQQNKRLNVQPLTIDSSTTLKLVQARSNSNIVSIGPYNVGGVKMRPLFNSNTIQHENGITTIVPASSLDVAKQSDALMQSSAPNTVTITPAPSNQIRLTTNLMNSSYQYCDGNESVSKLHINSNQNHLNLNNASLNQKFILLKTNANSAFGHNYNCNNNKPSSSDMM